MKLLMLLTSLLMTEQLYRYVRALNWSAACGNVLQVEDCPDSVLFLKAKWVWDCLGKKQLLPTDSYEH